MIELNFKQTHPNAAMPARATECAFGYDVKAVSVEDITKETFENSIADLPTWKKVLARVKRVFQKTTRLLRYKVGFVVQPKNTMPPANHRAILAVSRSSVYKTGLMLTNAEGVIDVDEYTGEMMFVFAEIDASLPHYRPGDRIGQIFFAYGEKLKFTPTNNIRETKRGNGGHGSTGR